MPYYVYMTASRRYGTLYLGVTNNLSRRAWQHKTKVFPGFSAKYGVDRLVWYETYERIEEAIAREKALKKWRRDWNRHIDIGLTLEQLERDPAGGCRAGRG